MKDDVTREDVEWAEKHYWSHDKPIEQDKDDYPMWEIIACGVLIVLVFVAICWVPYG